MSPAPQQIPSVGHFTVGWIAPLPYERAASVAMLDERLEPPAEFEKNDSDSNQYTWGRIGAHHIVIASLPSGESGNTAAAVAAASMLASLPSVRVGLLVGVGAGIPDLDQGFDIRLGDIAVSQPQGITGGVIQYDLIKAEDGIYKRTGMLNMPPAALRAGLAKLQAQHEMEASAIPTYLAAMRARYPQMAKSSRNKPGYVHQGTDGDVFRTAENEAVESEARDSQEPEIHYGTIVSGNTLVQDRKQRDLILDRLQGSGQIVCLETEAAGLMNHFPCLTIRGISSYADGADHNRWNRYAAATAAAFTKELLGCVDSQELSRTTKIGDLSRQLQDVQQMVHELAENTSNFSRTSRDATILRWLCPADTSNNFNNASAQRHGETGAWFLHSPEYQQWKRDRNTAIWLRGKPGSGKTVLSSTVINDLRNEHDSLVLMFYFDFNDSAKQSFLDMIRGLIAQMYYQNPDAREPLENLFSGCSEGNEEPSNQALIATLARMFEVVRNVTIVVDALDECSTITRKELLTWLAMRIADGVPILMTSRPEGDIEAFLTGNPQCTAMSFNVASVHHDISAYVRARLRGSQGFQRWESMDDVFEEIESKLLGKAGGMFRWVACQLDALQDCLDLPSLQDALDALPRDLEETYERILDRIPQEYAAKTTRLLQFLIHSERPLVLSEVVDIVAVRLDRNPAFTQAYRMPIPEDIARFCSSLVEIFTVGAPHVDQAPEHNEPVRRRKTYLRLAHMSVKEYLVSEKTRTSFRNTLRPLAIHRSIVDVCLAYLTSACRLRGLMHFVPLSARLWMQHSRYLRDDPEVQDTIGRFFLDKEAYALWRDKFDPTNPTRRRGTFSGMRVSALRDACIGGFHTAAERLVQQGAHVLIGSGPSTDALQAASACGHERLVSLLLEQGADTNTEGLDLGAALYAAVLNGYSSIARMLLGRGASVHGSGGDFGTPLYGAVSSGHLAVTEMLLERGADIHEQIGNQDTPLATAARTGNELMVQLLIDLGADPNRRGLGLTPLIAACKRGDRPIVELLLQARADINTIMEYGVPRRSIFPPMLDFGVDDVERLGWLVGDCKVGPWIISKLHETALQAASAYGHHDVVALLLEKGADVNAKCAMLSYPNPYGLPSTRTTGEWHLNALQAASAEGHASIVQLLLQYGADISAACGSDGNTALTLARDAGHESVVKLLEQASDSAKQKTPK